MDIDPIEPEIPSTNNLNNWDYVPQNIKSAYKEMKIALSEPNTIVTDYTSKRKKTKAAAIIPMEPPVFEVT